MGTDLLDFFTNNLRDKNISIVEFVLQKLFFKQVGGGVGASGVGSWGQKYKILFEFSFHVLMHISDKINQMITLTVIT
jgi:hypothetical protein